MTMGIVGEKPTTVNGGLIGLMKPQVLAETRASTVVPMATADSATPGMSNRPVVVVVDRSLILPLSGRISAMIMMVSAPNTQRQLRYVVAQPPMRGPAAAAAPATPPRRA